MIKEKSKEEENQEKSVVKDFLITAAKSGFQVFEPEHGGWFRGDKRRF